MMLEQRHRIYLFSLIFALYSGSCISLEYKTKNVDVLNKIINYEESPLEFLPLRRSSVNKNVYPVEHNVNTIKSNNEEFKNERRVVFVKRLSSIDRKRVPRQANTGYSLYPQISNLAPYPDPNSYHSYNPADQNPSLHTPQNYPGYKPLNNQPYPGSYPTNNAFSTNTYSSGYNPANSTYPYRPNQEFSNGQSYYNRSYPQYPSNNPNGQRLPYNSTNGYPQFSTSSHRPSLPSGQYPQHNTYNNSWNQRPPYNQFVGYNPSNYTSYPSHGTFNNSSIHSSYPYNPLTTQYPYNSSYSSYPPYNFQNQRPPYNTPYNTTPHPVQPSPNGYNDPNFANLNNPTGHRPPYNLPPHTQYPPGNYPTNYPNYPSDYPFNSTNPYNPARPPYNLSPSGQFPNYSTSSHGSYH